MEKTVLFTSLVAAGLFTLPLLMSSIGQGGDVARIEAQRTDGTLRLHSLFEASEAAKDSLRYEFEVNKQGASGTSTSRQGGTFRPSADSADTLSTVQVGVQAGDTVVARLRVTGPEGLVAEADLREVIR
jgi:hypothetical protein